jgi:predicted MFS family arabinose efflux permease
MFMNWFPGLEDRRIAWVLFAVGIAVYVGASIVFQICRKREKMQKDTWKEELK